MTDLLKYADVGTNYDEQNQRTDATIGGNAYDDGTGYSPVSSDEISKNLEAQNTGFLDAIYRAGSSGDNFAIQILKRVQRESLVEDDPNFRPDDWLKLHPDVPSDFQNSIRLAGSEKEANMVYIDMQKQMRDQDILYRRGGFSTFAARGIAGLIDVDTPLMFLSGGTELIGKGGMMATRFGRMMSGVATGAITNAASTYVGQEASTTPDWTSIPVAGLAGGFLGGLGGALGKSLPEDAYNASLRPVREEFNDFVEKGAGSDSIHISRETHVADPENMYQAGKEPQVFDPNEAQITETDLPDEPFTGGASAGAAQTNPSAVNLMSRGRSKDMVRAAAARDKALGVSDHLYLDEMQLENAGRIGATVAPRARVFQRLLDASPIGSDFGRWTRSPSTVARMFMYDALESPAGLIRNNRSAAAIMRYYEQRLQSHLIGIDDAYKQWAKMNAPELWRRTLKETELKEQFNREVLHELQARAYDPPHVQRVIDPKVKEAADAVDRFHAEELAIGQGRPGELGIKGYDQIQQRSGYFTQRWAGWKMENVIRKGFKEKDIVQAVAEGYLTVHTNLKKADALKIAQAVVTRARTKENGADANLIAILQQDGREFLADTLRNNGVSTQDIDSLITKLTSNMAERGQAGHTKARTDIDMRFVASNGIKLMDLFDTDVEKIVSRRARGTAGAAALARKGITSRADLNDLKQAILDEQKAIRDAKAGTPKPSGIADNVDELMHGGRDLTADDIDGLFSYFGSGPIAGGLSGGYALAKKITDLALLNQMGLTQLAETGAQMASVGVARWLEHMPAALKEALGNPKSPVVQELEHIGILLPEERLFRPDLALEVDRDMDMASTLMKTTNTILNRGRRLQGYISGFNAVRSVQHRIAVTAMLDKLAQNMNGMARDLSVARAADIGLDGATYKRIEHYFTNGTVQLDAKGRVQKLNLDKWNPDVAEDLIFALNRHADQNIQKAMIGESNYWFHKDGIASLFLHLKSFTMLALEKQSMRNLRIADQQSMNTFVLGLATAAAAYTVRQTLNGNDKNLTPYKIAHGALNYSNMTGWIPMWVNPIGVLFGIDSLKANPYGYGTAGGIVPIPPVVSTLNRMAGIPAALMHTATGSLDTNDINALQATPIFGNMTGMAAVWNGIKQHLRSSKKSADSIGESIISPTTDAN